MSKWLWLGILCASLLPQRGFAATSAEEAKDELIVQFRPGMNALEQGDLLYKQGLEVVNQIPAWDIVLAKTPRGQAAMARFSLMSNANIQRVEPNVWRDDWINNAPESLQETPFPVEETLRTLPKFQAGAAQDSAFHTMTDEVPGEVQWGVARVNAPAAWPTNKGDGIKVAVVDTGIDPNHPELSGRIAGGYNAIDKNASWADDHFHGTHVAGIIAAELDGKGVVGVAPKASLYAVKVLTKEGKGDLFAIMDGISWCAQNGIQVINMSLGAPQEMPMLEYSLQEAVNAGVTIVCAAGNGDGKGNSSPVNWPGAYKECITVSASDPDNHITKWSSRGPQVAFIAPGLKIPSTVPFSHDPTGIKAYSGTSMATPHVAGLAALAIAHGAASPDAVRAALTAAARKLPGLSSDEQGAGLIDASHFAK